MTIPSSIMAATASMSPRSDAAKKSSTNARFARSSLETSPGPPVIASPSIVRFVLPLHDTEPHGPSRWTTGAGEGRTG